MKSFRSAQTQRNDASSQKVVRLFQSETAEILEAPEPHGVRATLYVLAAFVVALFVLATVTQLDRVVTSVAAQVVTVEPTIVVQALDPSIVKTIDVREGERVKAGDLLATLDPTFATADVDALKLQIASLNAQIARCEAELAHRPYEPAPTADPAALRYEQLQRAYYLQRQGQFNDQIHSYDAQIAQTTATIAKLHNDSLRYADRADLAKQVEHMRATLAAAEVGSRLNLLGAIDQKTELLREVEYDRNSIVESQHQLASTIATRNAFTQQWFGQTSQELVTARNQRDTATESLEKATKHKDLVRMTASQDAVVLKMAKLSVGSVLNPGDPFIYLAPLHSPVEVAAHISTADIGFIRVGDPVTIKLDTFDYIEHGMAHGDVRWISEGAFTSDDNNAPVAPYYKVRIALTNVALRDVPPSFRLIPGMTLTADIHIGTRSILMYIVDGALRGSNEAMREP